MALDPQAQAFLEMGAKAKLPDISEQGARQARLNSHSEPHLAGLIHPDVDIVYEFFTGPTGDIPVAIYTPHGARTRPGLVYFHGGGWVINYISKYHAQLSNLAALTDSVIVSVNYQKAPEHKFPIPFDDCYLGLLWVIENANRFGIDTARIGIGGDSAGGNLASAVAIAARDRKIQPLAYQLLIYPCNSPDYVDSPSVANAEGFGLTQRGMKWLWESYLRDSSDRNNPYAVPHAETDFSNLAPAILITAEYDVLRLDGIAYKEKLEKYHTLYAYKDCPGMIHGFFNYGKYISYGITIRNWIADQITSIVGTK